jgi:hypothetical protein
MTVRLPNLSDKPDPGSGYTLIGYPFGEASGMTSTIAGTGNKIAVIDPAAARLLVTT